MFNIVEKRHWYFLLSALIIIPGLVAMIYSIAMYRLAGQAGHRLYRRRAAGVAL